MSLNFANITTSDFVLKGTGNNVHLKAITPNALKKDLMVKRLLCQSVYLTTGSIPRFIPLLATAARHAYNAGASVTNWDNLGTNSLQVISNTDYFFNIRKPDNTECYTSTIFWANVNNIAQPPAYLPDENSIYYIPYYYCYDITQFFDMMADTLNVGFVQATGGALANPCTVLYDASTNTVNISIPKTLSDGWNVEMSPSLTALMGMATTNVNFGTYITNQIKWSPLLISINGVDYVNASAKLQPNLFPFDRYVVASDLPVTPVGFHVSTDPVIGGGFSEQVLFMWREGEVEIQSGVPINMVNDNMFEKQKTFEEDTYSASQIEFKLLLRSKKNQNWIEWVLPVGEKLEITLNTVRLF